MKVKVVESIEELKRLFGLQNDGVLLETDLDVVENDCELFGRKRRDAEVLCTLAANSRGNCLDLGTSHGRSAFKLATNLNGNGRVFTVNILPEQYDRSGGQLITHLLSKEEIGTFYRAHQLQNIEQIYANTARWTVPPEINDLAIVFVDAAHDTEMVYADTKRIYDRVRNGGFILWHDFSPFFRAKHGWIDAVMRGVEKFLTENQIEDEIVHLRNSWVGILQKGRGVKSAVEVSPSAHPAPLPPAERFQRVRFAWVFPAYSQERLQEEEGWASRIRPLGYEIELFPIPCPEGWWPFPKLHQAWLNREPSLMQAYNRIAARVRSGDVLVASGGAMVHPEFVRQLPTLNVFVCGDDPESSDFLSRPAAPSFDVSLIGNVACVELYRSWGCRHVDWLYQAIRPEFLDPAVNEVTILTGKRDLDIVMFCERVYGCSDRAQRLERLAREFPQALLRGKGWPGGYVSEAERRAAYGSAKIGWNLHNSVGPCNMRLVTLPAMGVMQICDNQSHLGKLFQLDEEIVGFNTLEECIEKTRYYLAHDEQRRIIAAHGWRRAVADFTEPKQWSNLLAKIHSAYCEKFDSRPPSGVSAATQVRPGRGEQEALHLRASNHRPVRTLFAAPRVGIATAERRSATYEPAHVRALVREAIALYTGDGRGFEAFLRGGERVLIKPNWVLHFNKSDAGMDCMVTHPEFVLATVELVAAQRPSRIVLADAPLQRCQWDKLVTPELRQRLRDAACGVPVEFIDFRRTVMAGASLSADVIQDRRAPDRYVLFDLGADSLLEPITEEGNFRVTMYSPDEMARRHCRGRHQYLLARDVFEADVVLNLPKLKTHRKSGLTAALKNLVGINGNKDYLPHHRFGGSDIGGDCYPGWAWWKHAAELYYDAANRAIGTPAYDVWIGRAERLLELFRRFYDADLEGGWHGNDTCWRMNLDLNRCLLYGDAEGLLHDAPQRRVLNLTDAIICGQGEGPLAPSPLPLGAVTFSEWAAAADLAHGALLRL
ncbi:MAG: DUF362 domain-containing protein, partial [Chloroflexi bacterium]|nr:DUF362 domain-containing protein [Chloroflexota bacterium]